MFVLGSIMIPDPIVDCFLEGTKITCLENDKEIVKNIQDLRCVDQIKTYREGYKNIKYIGKKQIKHILQNEKNRNSLYELKKENYADLFENLVITGKHDILIDEENKVENQQNNGKLHDKYRHVPMFESYVQQY